MKSTSEDRARRWRVLSVVVAALIAQGHLEAQASGGAASAVQGRLAIAQPVPPLNGANVVIKVLEVTYPPGASSEAHRHPCAVIGYMLEGAMRMQLKGRPEVTYKTGETFYEPPNAVHAIAANASKTKRARFTVTFVCDRETPLMVPAPGEGTSRPR